MIKEKERGFPTNNHRKSGSRKNGFYKEIIHISAIYVAAVLWLKVQRKLNW